MLDKTKIIFEMEWDNIWVDGKGGQERIRRKLFCWRRGIAKRGAGGEGKGEKKSGEWIGGEWRECGEVDSIVHVPSVPVAFSVSVSATRSHEDGNLSYGMAMINSSYDRDTYAI